jgi:hypothetical protein
LKGLEIDPCHSKDKDEKSEEIDLKEGFIRRKDRVPGFKKKLR